MAAASSKSLNTATVADDVTSDDDIATEYTQLIPGSQSPDVDDGSRSLPRPGDADIKVYRRRWYILAVFSLLTCSQSTLDNIRNA